MAREPLIKSHVGATAALQRQRKARGADEGREPSPAEQRSDAPAGPRPVRVCANMRRLFRRTPRHRSREPEGGAGFPMGCDPGGDVSDRLKPARLHPASRSYPLFEGAQLHATRSRYNLRRPSHHHPHVATNALYGGLNQRFPKGFFVVGTDTGVGKTTISCALLHALGAQGYRTIGMKPVATGVTGSATDDLEQLKTASNVSADKSLLNPYAFRAPIAPHIAADQEQTTIELSVITQAYQDLTRLADIIIVEGIGGFKVPLGVNCDTANLVVALSLPVILVVGLRLGCLNHALLTYEALKNRAVPVAAWVANQIDPNLPAFDENVQALKERLEAPLLGVVPYDSSVNYRDASKHLNVVTLGLPVRPSVKSD